MATSISKVYNNNINLFDSTARYCMILILYILSRLGFCSFLALACVCNYIQNYWYALMIVVMWLFQYRKSLFMQMGFAGLATGAAMVGQLQSLFAVLGYYYSTK